MPSNTRSSNALFFFLTIIIAWADVCGGGASTLPGHVPEIDALTVRPAWMQDALSCHDQDHILQGFWHGLRQLVGRAAVA